MQRLCVFCGSSPGRRAEYRGAADRLGTELAARRIELVYGGGNVGLMGVLADAVLRGGGLVIGVIPDDLVKREVAHFGVSELRIVGSMHERKQIMADLSDGFMALPGGIGTLEELTEVLTWAQLGLHAKPCGLLNVAGFYQPYIDLLDHALEERFLAAEHRAMLLVGDDPAALLDRFAAYRPPRVEKWIDRERS